MSTSTTPYFVLTRFRGPRQSSFVIEEFVNDKLTPGTPRQYRPGEDILADIEQRWQPADTDRDKVEDLLKDVGPSDVCIGAKKIS